MAFDATGKNLTERYRPNDGRPPGMFATPGISIKRPSGLLVPIELAAYGLLQSMVETKDDLVFPQVHLLQTFDIDLVWLMQKLAASHVAQQYHQSVGVELRGAWFAWRSIDFLLCNPQTTKIVRGIEIDDYSHDTPEGKARDDLKDLIFQRAGVELLRFRDTDITTVVALPPLQQQAAFSALWVAARQTWAQRKIILAALP
jgi:hypothetical protein